MLSLYRAATAAVAPFARLILEQRRFFGKEDPERLSERLGYASRAREAGRLVWMHGASVGEGLVLLSLAPRLTAKGWRVLITTGTVTSARIVSARLPPGATHQFAPMDFSRNWRRFLGHWRPDVLLVAESELWPNMLRETRLRGAPIALVNARMSPRSYGRWRRHAGAIRALLAHIDICLAQSDGDAARFADLGAANVVVAGNLKYDAPAPPVDADELAALSGLIGARPVWLAASTHAGEDEIALETHRRLSARFPHLLTIIAPRHAERGADIEDLANRRGLSVARRSLKQAPDAAAAIYIADTMGEAGLYYRLAGVVFVGKSLASGGGQNPIEPAKLGGAVLHGPHVQNFVDVYADLDAAGGALEVRGVDDLTAAVDGLLGDGARMRRMARAAAEAVERIGGAGDIVMRELEPWLAPRRGSAHPAPARFGSE